MRQCARPYRRSDGGRREAAEKAVEAGRARYVFLAENADPAVIEPIVLLCRSKEVQTAWVPSMAVLGRACGIEVGAAAAAVVD